jgi:hypothetical protein
VCVQLAYLGLSYTADLHIVIVHHEQIRYILVKMVHHGQSMHSVVRLNEHRSQEVLECLAMYFGICNEE